jgi:hypothetical protein
MAKPDKAANENQARGRNDAPGQNKMRQFVNDAGETVEGTMNDFHTTLREQGYRPVDDADNAEDGEAVSSGV